MTTTRFAVVGLGASLGDRVKSLALATRCLAASAGVRVVAVSRAYRTAPVGPASSPFLNAAVLISTSHSPRGLLAICRGIERRLGRQRAQRWADRVIDLDLLLMDGIVRRGRGLTLPHPRLLQRDFALLPAREVAPWLVHPLASRALADLPLPTMGTGCVATAVIVPRAALAGVGSLQYSSAPVGASARRSLDRPPHRRPTHRRPTMKFFLDTANLDEIREAHAWGVIDGVTTNPSLVAKEGGDLVETIHQICELVQGPVSAETVATDWQGMVREGRLLAQISEHVVVKVPLTLDGIRATRVLADDGIDVNVTLCFQPAQALLAAKAGAAYISPFIGRLDDISTDGVQLIEQIVQIYRNYPDLGTEVLAASVRHPMHVTQVAMAGADVATIPFSTIERLVKHPLTDSGIQRFLADWEGVPDPDVAGAVERWLAARGGR